MKKALIQILMALWPMCMVMADVLPFPEDTIAYNDRFNNRQWVRFDAEGFLHITYTGQYGTDSQTRDIYYVNNKSGAFVTTQVTDTGVDNNYSSFVLDDEGNVHMVYIQRDQSNMFQLVYQHNSDGDFSEPVWITAGSNKATPHIAIGPDNVLHFVYYEFNANPPNYAFYTTYDPATGTSGPVTQLNGVHSPPSGENDIHVGVDSDNVAHVVLREGSSWGGTLRYYNNLSGQMEEEVTPVNETIEYPVMTIDHDDKVHILYRRNSDKRLAYFTRDKNDGFSDVVAATPPGTGLPSFYRTVATDAEGRFYFTYQNSQAAAPVGFFLVSGYGGVFEEPILVWNDPEGLYLLRNSNSVAARGDGEIAVFYAPSASRDGQIVCDIFMKKGFLFAEEEPLIEISPASLAFGEVETGTSAELTLMVYNHGPVTLNLLDLQFSDDVFFCPTDGPHWVEPFGSLALPVVFFPEEEGVYNETLTIVSDAANAPEVTVNLSGEGVHYYAIIDVWESYHFYNVLVNTTAEGVTGGYSDGNIDLVIHYVEITGEDVQAFDFQADLPMTVPPGEHADILVFFSPDEVREYSANLVIHSNAENCEVCGIALIGHAIPDETSLSEPEAVISIYPNPARENLHIESDKPIESIRLIDMLGKTVYSAQFSDHSHFIDVTGMHAGLYFLQIVSRSETVTYRVQVVR
ncbi:MAG: choice-of-anchor D domain-containing protein [Bacteroidia bacterium]|nr:MAG: choice-of-anchor D domain-containing protein [Bacteroidia bacterium]